MFKSSAKLIVINLLLLNVYQLFTGDSVRKLKIAEPIDHSGLQSDFDFSDSSDPLGLFEPLLPTVKVWAGLRGLKDSFELPRTKEMLLGKKLSKDFKAKEMLRSQQIMLAGSDMQTNFNPAVNDAPAVPKLGTGIHDKKD